MTIDAWRIVMPEHVKTAFTGTGAQEFGGRWNSPGTAVVYAAGSPALAALELLARLNTTELLEEYRLFKVRFDRALVDDIDRERLPRNWRSASISKRVRRLGDAWATSLTSAVLRVPSAVIEGECNYLLNPAHPDIERLTIGRPRRFVFDPRLIKQAE